MTTAIVIALKAGGVVIQNDYAKNFGPKLLAANFQKITDLSTYTPMAGDITVYDGNSSHTSGHIQMYTGQQWTSDWYQGLARLDPTYAFGGSGFQPYSSTIYRYAGPIVN